MTLVIGETVFGNPIDTLFVSQLNILIIHILYRREPKDIEI